MTYPISILVHETDLKGAATLKISSRMSPRKTGLRVTKEHVWPSSESRGHTAKVAHSVVDCPVSEAPIQSSKHTVLDSEHQGPLTSLNRLVETRIHII